MTDPTVTAVSDERLREFAFGPRHTAPLFAEMESMARELLRARSALADVGECETCKGVGRTPALLGRILGKCVTCNGTGKQPRPAAEAVCTHCMFTPEERAHPEHYNVRPCRYCSPAAEAK